MQRSCHRSTEPVGVGHARVTDATTILLIRHAAHGHLGTVLSGRLAGLALSEAGRGQAAALADRLCDQPLAAIYSSPVQRARETAAAIAAGRAEAVEIAPALDEVDFGEWAGRSFAELAHDPQWQAWNAARDTAGTPGGETMRQAQARAVAQVAAAARAHPGKTVAIVSHCDIIRAVIAHHLALGLEHLLRFDIDPASVSRLVFDGSVRVGAVNVPI